MSNSPLRDKSKEFAKQIVFLCREIKSTHKESVLTNQLLRSGTSIGANLHEAQYAQGTKDFISKLEIAERNVTKRSIGWNCFLTPDIYRSLSTAPCKTIAERSDAC